MTTSDERRGTEKEGKKEKKKNTFYSKVVLSFLFSLFTFYDVKVIVHICTMIYIELKYANRRKTGKIIFSSNSI